MFFLGLFSKGVAFSGTNLASWSLSVQKGVARKRAKQLAGYFGCYNPKKWSQTIDCLRNVSATKITAALYKFFVNINLSKSIYSFYHPFNRHLNFCPGIRF